MPDHPEPVDSVVVNVVPKDTLEMPIIRGKEIRLAITLFMIGLGIILVAQSNVNSVVSTKSQKENNAILNGPI